MASRLFKSDALYFWPTFWDNHPEKSDKKEKKKWRILKNSLAVVLRAKEKFQIDQDKVAYNLEKLSSLKYPFSQTHLIPIEA